MPFRINFQLRAIISLLILAGLFTGTYIANRYFPNSKSTEVFSLTEVVDDLNQGLPVMIDEETRLDSVTSPQANTLAYNYTILDEEIKPGEIEEFEEQITPYIIDTIKQDPDIEVMRAEQITFVVNYMNTEQQLLLSIEVTPADYE